jgi:hypothetical protein
MLERAMNISSINLDNNLGKEYLEHPLFEQLEKYLDFYDSMSFSIMGFLSQGTQGIINHDTYAYSSIMGTIDSIKCVLEKGRINDAYALLRKYFDSTLINIYVNLYLEANFNIDNLVVAQIQEWIDGKKEIPRYRVISKYIKDSNRLEPINKLLNSDDRYVKIRDRCNDNTHYNFYRNFLLNDNKIYNPNRIKYLNVFSKDIENIFIQHFAYIFYLNDHYMMSSDYVDSLDLGLTPEDGSQYWVAPFIKEIFYEIVNVKRPDIAREIADKSSMEL